MMIDVESIGLHGGAFAVAWLVKDTQTGEELESGCYAVDRILAWGDLNDRKWVDQNVPHIPATHESSAAMRQDFWEVWRRWADKAVVAADCPWPVESRFLNVCIDHDVASRKWQGPYPILDVVSVRLGAGQTFGQAMESGDRLPDELPVHHPLADCRQSMRVLIEAMKERDAR